MRFDLHLRSTVKNQIEHLSRQMQSWEQQSRISLEEVERIRTSIYFFAHTTKRQNILFAGVDGSGDYPMLSYADSFIYLTVAQGVIYQNDVVSGLREVDRESDPLTLFTWFPEDQSSRDDAYDEAFSALAGMPVEQVIQESDYGILKARLTGKENNVSLLKRELIRPHASDAGNIAIQLRSAGEFGAAIRIIHSEPTPHYLLVNTTLSLPSVSLPTGSIFYEHLKRLCCVEARKRKIGFFALSKSHGLPGMDGLEAIAREVAGLEQGKIAEHWYIRLPSRELDGWEMALVKANRLPPVGAISYMVRFHHTTQVMRLDMDKEFWHSQVQGESEIQTLENERRIFEDLDYSCHDQRCYGYPYPIKAGHDRASLTKQEREALRKQVVDAAVKAGLKRSLFREASLATGHE